MLQMSECLWSFAMKRCRALAVSSAFLHLFVFSGCAGMKYAYRKVVVHDTQGVWMSTLVLAARAGDLETVRQIVSRGDTDLDWRPGPSYGNALEAAVGHNHYEVAELLLRHGADPNGGADSPWNPLSIACGNRYRRLVKLLLRYGADPNFRHDSGAYPILNCRSIPILEDLIAAGGNLGLAYDTTGGTLLMSAVIGNRYDLVRFLVEHGCPLNSVDNDAMSAFDYAERDASRDIQNYLRLHGAKRAGELSP